MKLLPLLTLMIIALTTTPLTSYAYEAGDIIVRAGVALVAPTSDSDKVKLNGSTLSLSGGDSTLDVDDNAQLGLTATYMLNRHWGIELLAATPFEHTASGEGELDGLDIADVKHLPPTLNAIYYFNSQSHFKPYVGAGLNYTIFFDEELTSEADTALSGLGLNGGDVSLDDSFGLALQVGADYSINDHWHINASIRWIDIDTEAEIEFNNGDKISADIEIDPFVYTLAASYKF